MSRCYAILGALMLVSACSAPREIAPEPKAPAPDVTTFLQTMRASAGAYTVEEITAMFGDPVRMQMRGDSLHMLRYYGWELGMKKQGVAYGALTDARYTAPEGVRVGYATKEILRLLGTPAHRGRAEMRYDFADLRMIIFLERDVVSRVEWWFAPGEHGGR